MEVGTLSDVGGGPTAPLSAPLFDSTPTSLAVHGPHLQAAARGRPLRTYLPVSIDRPYLQSTVRTSSPASVARPPGLVRSCDPLFPGAPGPLCSSLVPQISQLPGSTSVLVSQISQPHAAFCISWLCLWPWTGACTLLLARLVCILCF